MPRTPEPILAFWAGVMVITAAIDLLASLRFGSANRNGSGPRFQNFVKMYLGLNNVKLSEKDAAILWDDVRCALDHSFQPGKACALARGENAVVVMGDGGQKRVDVFKLLEAFENAVVSYRNELAAAVPPASDAMHLLQYFTRVHKEVAAPVWIYSAKPFHAQPVHTQPFIMSGRARSYCTAVSGDATPLMPECEQPNAGNPRFIPLTGVASVSGGPAPPLQLRISSTVSASGGPAPSDLDLEHINDLLRRGGG
jgi:hypothetical protein